MPALAIELRRNLEKVVTEAREKAEVAARAALKRMAVDAAKPFDEMTPAQRDLRNRLRARGRQAGTAAGRTGRRRSSN
jgi:ribosomal protein L17